MSIRPIASTYPTVGFFGRSSRSRPHNKQHKKKRGQVIPAADSTAIPDSETLLEFDSGRRMTFAQGTRSTLVIGGTGSGKTASVVLPMAIYAFQKAYNQSAHPFIWKKRQVRGAQLANSIKNFCN